MQRTLVARRAKQAGGNARLADFFSEQPDVHSKMSMAEKYNSKGAGTNAVVWMFFFFLRDGLAPLSATVRPVGGFIHGRQPLVPINCGLCSLHAKHVSFLCVLIPPSFRTRWG